MLLPRDLVGLPPQTDSDTDDDSDREEAVGTGQLPVTEIPVERKRQEGPPVDPRLPQPPFRLGLIAPTGAGKTVLAVNLLLRSHFYKGYFEKIFLWSPTFEENPEWEEVDDQITEVFEDFDNLNLELQSIVDAQHSEQARTMIIFDDADEVISKNEDVIHLMKRGRHFNISVVLITQHYNTLCSKIRTQFSNIVVFRIPGGLELKTITDRQRGHLSKREFEKALAFATRDPFSFLHINHQAADRSMHFMKNFDVKIFPGDSVKEDELPETPKIESLN